MATVFAVLLWALATAIGLMIVVLVLPVHFSLRLASGAPVTAGAEIRLLAGLAPPIRIKRPCRSPESEPGRWHRRPKRRPARARKYGGAAAGRLVKAAPRALGRMIRKVHVERIEIDGDLGFGDPADTGEVFGWLMPLIHALPSRRVRLDLRPDFAGARVDLRAEAAFSFIPAALLPPLAALFWTAFGVRR
ncbi:hypothetical protein [Defluviimonas sp. SAOS-178_SWC]|uniref:hypothetical protein n=1 Tax=Defluviimonas sp. SAOS-178_SWC TaxID=3121287 RepID=UPI0032215B9C